jgi:hypothetical protein
MEVYSLSFKEPMFATSTLVGIYAQWSEVVKALEKQYVDIGTTDQFIIEVHELDFVDEDPDELKE